MKVAITVRASKPKGERIRRQGPRTTPMAPQRRQGLAKFAGCGRLRRAGRSTGQRSRVPQGDAANPPSKSPPTSLPAPVLAGLALDGPDQAGRVPTQDWERSTAALMHATVLMWFVLVPFVPALGLWLWRRRRSAFLDDHGREAMNFQLSLLIYAGFSLLIINVATCGVGVLVVTPMLVALGLVGMALSMRRAWRGEVARCPMCLRLIEPRW